MKAVPVAKVTASAAAAAPPKTPAGPIPTQRTHRLFSPPTPGAFAGARLAEAAGEKGPQPTLSQLGVTSPAKLKEGAASVALSSKAPSAATSIHMSLSMGEAGAAAVKTWDVSVGEAGGENTAPLEGARGKRGNSKAPAAATTTTSRANSRGKAGAR